MSVKKQPAKKAVKGAKKPAKKPAPKPAQKKPALGEDARHERFAAEYLTDFNASKAAIRAGYSAKTAGSQGSRLLKDVRVQNLIRAGQKKVANKLEITKERVLEEYARIAFFDVRQLFREDGSLKEVSELDDDTAAAVASIEIDSLFEPIPPETSAEGQPHGGWLKRNRSKLMTGQTAKIKLVRKEAALSDLAKHLDLFKGDAPYAGMLVPPGFTGRIEVVGITPKPKPDADSGS